MDLYSTVWVVLVFGLILPFLSNAPAYAVEQTGIVLSNTCKIMIKNNLTTNCPTYEELMIIFPDSSIQSRSGEFYWKDGMYQRGPAQMEDHYEFYRYHNTSVLWIDPPKDIIDRYRTITIEASDFEYTLPDNANPVGHGTLETGVNRYVSTNCFRATITSSNYIFLLGDTLRYMLHKCDPEYTNFNSTKITTWETTQHDIATSAKWKLAQFVKQVYDDCRLRLCIPK